MRYLFVDGADYAMKKRDMMTCYFKVAAEALCNGVLQGNLHLDLCKGIGRIDPLIGNYAPMFFTQTYFAHLYEAQLYAYKLFDSQKDTVTVPKYLVMSGMRRQEFMASQLEVMDEIAKAGKVIETLRPTIKILELRRHKYLAHTSQHLVFDRDSFLTGEPLNYEMVRAVLMMAGNIVNNLFWLYCERRDPIVDHQTDDYKRAINLMCDQMCVKADKVDDDARRVGWNRPSPRPKPCE
jgi:hypothetical protein